MAQLPVRLSKPFLGQIERSQIWSICPNGTGPPPPPSEFCHRDFAISRVLKRLNVGWRKQHHVIAQGLVFWRQNSLVGDAPFPLKFASKVTHPPFEHHHFASKIQLLSKKVCYKVSLCETSSGKVVATSFFCLMVHRWIAGDVPIYLKFALKLTHPFR